MVGLALRAPRRPAAADAPLRQNPWRAPLAVALLALGTRLLLLRWFFYGWFYVDENFAGCVEPMQFLLGEPIWMGAFYISYLAYLGGYYVFGYAPTVPRIVSTLVVAAAGGAFHAAMRRAIGARSAWIASVWFIAAAPFTLHSLHALQLGLGLLPVAVLAWVLSHGSLGPWHGIVIGPLLVVALYTYPASFLACGSLLAVHAVLHRDRWRWSGRFAAATGLVVGGAAAVAIRRLVTGAFNATQWGGGAFALAEVPAALWIMLADTLWRTTSFDGFNLGAAYLDPALQGFVLVGIAVGWRERDAGWRWAMTGALAFALTLVLASLAHPTPGIRRAFAAFGLLGLPLARGVRESARRMPRGVAAVMSMAALGLVLWHTERLVTWWPHYPEPDFVAGARAMLAAEDMAGRDAIVIAEKKDMYVGQAWRCALVLDERLRPRLGRIVAVPRADLDGQRGLVPGRAVVLASTPLPPENLRSAFGRDPVRTISRTPNAAGDFLRLGVLYVFDPDATAP